MLRELHIANLAVIEDLTVHLTEGLNVFTGQTGAGKSLILGAFEVLLGLRPATDMIRPGAAEARIVGVFEVGDPETARAIGAELDQAIVVGEPLLLARKLFASGRSSLSVNGQPVTAAMVRRVAERLVDIHGQHDHQCLLRPANQLQLLDVFAEAGALRERFAGGYQQLRALERQRVGLVASASLREQQLELYRFQASEIDAVAPQAGEYQALSGRQRLLGSVERLRQEAGAAHAALYESEGAAIERLQEVLHRLDGVAELDEPLGAIAEQVRGAALTLQEAAHDLSRYGDRLDGDPEALAEVEVRLGQLHRLIQKYGGGAGGARASLRRGRGAVEGVSPVTDEDALLPVLAHRVKIGAEIQRLEQEEVGLGQIDGQIAALSVQLLSVGKQLSAARRQAAERLSPQVEAGLRELGMAEACFAVAVEPRTAADVAAEAAGKAATEQEHAESEGHAAGQVAGGLAGLAGSAAGISPLAWAAPTGLDHVEFLVQTNPGQSRRPLRKIASGGELSRVMLAIKSILAGSDRVSVLVFDEIDSNIGGRLGQVIGGKLRAIAQGNHQVLVITHLPQIAAFADRHFRIEKVVSGTGKTKTTRTTVSVLAGENRVEELAEMMAGQGASATSRKQAQELLAAAA